MNRQDPYQIVHRPLQSEKAFQCQESGKYVFRVSPGANKQDIKWAIHKIYGVEVTRVNTANYDGKQVRRGRIVGRKPAWKKAIVKLAAGQSIDSI